MNLPKESRLLIVCARNGMLGDNREEIDFLLSSGIEWDELLDAANSQGIAHLMYKSLKDLPEKSPVPQEVTGKLRTACHGNVARNMYLYYAYRPIELTLKYGGYL